MTIRSLRRLLIVAAFTIIANSLFAQGYSFNCARDTVVPGCPASLCITLKSLIPDPHRQSTSYAVNSPAALPSCLLAAANPGVPGAPTSLNIDDKYSPVFPIGFPFIFFGVPKNDLIVSSNGYICFNTALTGLFSHWNIINGSTPQNLPSTFYDGDIIMGPYHDIDVSITTSPNRLISYQTFGLAPYRKWVLSYYKIPLFSTACNSMFENTHQITLYESTGIIDVNIFDMQICPSWNQGRAMIGVQNAARDIGVMVPGRRASDPPWGAVGQTEKYRFVPVGGTPLFRRVELYTIGGTLVSTGTTVQLADGDREASFPNICVPPGTTNQFVVKAFYDKIDDPLTEIYGTDTVTVDRTHSLVATPVTNAATCGTSNGTITVNSTSGGTGPYEYSLDGITWQSSNVFNGQTAGPHTVYIRDALGTCTANYNVNIGTISNLSANTSKTDAACTGINNGTITITSATGTAPFSYNLDNLGFQAAAPLPQTINGLAPGSHTVVVRDASGCVTNTINVTINTGTGVSASATSTLTSCSGATDGTITVNTSAGTSPFTYQLGTGTPQSSNTFNGLAAGTYTITVTDNVGCKSTFTRSVTAGAPLAASNTPSATSCTGASNGSVLITPSTGSGPYTFVLDGVTTQTGATNTTFNNLAPGPHNVVVTDNTTTCQSNQINFTIVAGPQITTTASKTDALCNGGLTGSITVTQPLVGTAPFEYSIDGVTWQTNPTFSGLAAGVYNVRYREANGCQNNLSITVSEPPVLSLAVAAVAVVCNGESNGIITATPTGGVGPYEYSIDGGATWQPTTTFNVAAGNYTIHIRDANGCTTMQNQSVSEPPVLNATSANTAASCDGGNDGVINVTANGGNASYQYSIDAVNFQPGNTFNVAPGNYTVTVKDNLGCSYSFPTTVALNNNLTFTPQIDPTICESKSVQLDLVSNATVYAWSPAVGLSSTSVHNPVANPTTTTDYTVTATLGRCSNVDHVTVNVNAAPIPDAGQEGFICFGQTYTLHASGGSQYSWTPSTYLDNPTSPNPVSTPTKDITYTLSIIADGNGCASLITDQVKIDVTPPIKVKTYPYDTVVYAMDLFTLLAVPSDSDVVNYSWTPSLGLSDPTIPNPVVTAGEIGDVMRYRVVTSTIAGCKGEGFVTVKVYKGPDIYMPTGFTPNNDGKNDLFIPFPVGIKKINYFRVYNRWGQLVFSTTALHVGWDGKIAGKDQSTGTFVWMIEGITENDRVITKKGTVTLIR